MIKNSQHRWHFTASLVKQCAHMILYKPVQNSNNKRSITSGGGTIDFSTQLQDMLDTLWITAGHRVVEESFSAWKLCVHIFSSHRLPETTKVLFAEQRENVILAMLVSCEKKAKVSLWEQEAAVMLNVVCRLEPALVVVYGWIGSSSLKVAEL